MPGYYCKFKDCNNNNATSKKRFYRFPKDEERCREWIKLLGMQELLESKSVAGLYNNYRLCEDHFSSWCFMNPQDKQRLVPNALPLTPNKPAVVRKNTYSVSVDSVSEDLLEGAASCDRMLKSEVIDFPSPSVLKEAIQHHFKTPVLFKNAIKLWMSWSDIPSSIEQLSSEFGNTSLSFRVVSKANKNISWEGNADYVEATINQFLDWQCGKSSTENSNPFHHFSPDKFWAYSSYNYLNDTFHEDSSILKTVDWSAFGFSETSGEDSAFWMGSEGSYTPCHFDTYGFNLVAQIQGRKNWILFPPEDTPFMYPTRIPYEESSVFSSVNILDPDFKLHPLFKCSHPHTVTLEPGDVLFVPNKWWHFVQNVTISLSINTWMKLDSDSYTHLEEGVTRALMSSFISYFEPIGESWLNPNEELASPEETLSYIALQLPKIKNAQAERNSEEDPTSSSTLVKNSKKVVDTDVHSNSLDILYHYPNIKCLTPEPFLTWYGKAISSDSKECLPAVNMRNIVNCFVHPEVVSVICKLLKNL